ncbi:hypothetical protein BDA99DRAFT_119175 [Phascolomyces articulosus]|uniref:F-box protein n=1 Tax=Phascolomyces articulosus TaxID=60185 RepID=A0AAD5PJI7_9FUNG|nr:hypothetical protein BDA99DRAFT_119175 [Phascolomyces articulosus]
MIICVTFFFLKKKKGFTKSLAGSDIHQLVRIVRHMSSSLQQIELNDCSTTHNDIVKYLLPACSPGLSYLSFSRKEVRGPKNDYGRRHVVAVHYTFRLCRAPEKIHKSLEPNNINYTTLTYLKLDSHFAPLKSHNSKSSDMPAMILIKQCPNLIHLFLPACDKYSYISDCLLQAIRSCPQLITLVISVNADMPQTIVSNIDESEYHITSTTTPADTTKSALLLPSSNDKLVSSSTTIPEKKNNLWNRTSAIGKSTTPSTSCLRRFVFVQYYRDIKPDVFLQVFRASHASLELLYLSYDDCSLGADALNKLASLGCPKLREFRLSTGDNSPILGLRISTISMSTVLVRLFSACPNLEAIELDDSRWDTVRLLQISRHVVETIATKCLRLRHLHIFDSRNPLFLADRSPKAYLSFINNNKENGSRKNNGDSYQIMGEEGHGVKQNTARLESLKLTELDHETAYSLVKNLASLKHLHLKWWMENGETDNRYLEEEMKKILLRREGSLIIGDQANK